MAAKDAAHAAALEELKAAHSHELNKLSSSMHGDKEAAAAALAAAHKSELEQLEASIAEVNFEATHMQMLCREDMGQVLQDVLRIKYCFKV